MSPLTAPALVVIQRQLGSITASQLRQCGVSDWSRRRLIDDRVLEPMAHSVYRVPGVPLTVEARLVVLCLQHPSGFITGPTAGALAGLRRMPQSSQVHLCTPHGLRLDVPNFVLLRQSTVTPPEHVRALANGIRLATFDRLSFDLARDLTVPDLSSVIEQLLQRNDTSVEALGAMARLLCAKGRPGSDVFAKVMLRRHDGAAAESHPELLVLRGLLRAGVPVQAQERLVLPNGRSVRIDMAVPEVRWAVEVDVHSDHLGLEGSTKDKRRDRGMHSVDWQIERVTRIDLLDLRGILEELVALYHRRLSRFSSFPRVSA